MWKQRVYLMCLILVLCLSGTASARIIGWWNEDVGAPLPGDATESGGTFTITANGNDIFDASDSFHYVYKLLSGDGEISARVVSIGGPSGNSWRKAGVMIREELSSHSFHAFMSLTPTPSHSLAFQYRDVAGDSDSEHGVDSVSQPYWVKLVRQGNQFTGYHSSDGVNWVQKSTAGEEPGGVNPVTIIMDTDVHIGLAVTSHEAGQLCTCEFDDVNVVGNITDKPMQLKAHSPIPADAAENVNLNDIGGMLSWSIGDTAVWQYAFFGTSESAVANAGTTSPEFVSKLSVMQTTMMLPRFVQPATTYYWRIDQEEGDGNIVTGDVWSFTTVPLKSTDPVPADGAGNVDPNADLSWTGGWDSFNGFDVYFGTSETDVTDATTESPECVSSGQMLPSYDPGPLTIDTTYYWRIDDKGATTYKGDTWNFTTIWWEILASTPPMGWNSWNRFRCNISETLIMEIADAMVASGMKDAGYVYINIDDCWHGERDASGYIHADPTRFPSGIAALADYVHSKGLKLGIYSDAGTLTCERRPGSKGYEQKDADQYAAWGVDYLKYDWCYTSGQDVQQSYTLMHDCLLNTGQPIVFSICSWSFPGPWVTAVGNLWRTTGDISDSWHSMVSIIDINANLYPYAGPGHWNDPDMLEVGNGGMTDTEYRAHFSMWCIMAAPLIAGNDLRNMSPSTLEILTAPEVIAVDQDPLGKQGRRVRDYGDLEVWVKELMHGNRAVALFNRSSQPSNITVLFTDLGWDFGDKALIRDLWAREDLGAFTDSFHAEVPGHGVVLVKALPNQHDRDADGDVDFVDFADFGSHWLESMCGTCGGADFNDDGQVGPDDLKQFVVKWLRLAPGLVAWWKLDEKTGTVAYDTASDKDATLHGDPNRLPEGGRIDGAIEFDGIDDYLSTPFVLNPADGPFSVYAWIKGGNPGQQVISQIDGNGIGVSWFCAETTTGKLMTGLCEPGRDGRPLVSEFVITDGDWHRIGFVWDGTYRSLYVDGAKVTTDTDPRPGLVGAGGGLHVGAAKDLDPTRFFVGLIDDVRVYDRAVMP